mgnify:CR=1 FL=1
MEKRKDDPILIEQKRKWSRNCFQRMKEENGERYLKKKNDCKARYWINMIKNSDDTTLILDRLKKKDIELFNNIKETLIF